ncbi:hypothetical protein B5X24_HaOG214496 [Helicoverpa armigera]|uniref:Uncharacterized protein n=1 Tax=Helicoverpa armigera TaxID=29058 RepID=A0A2W1BDF1_HELAM|nr:hypothetical protein B5X24_HaOG214496 [Helicoverpa armigera]
MDANGDVAGYASKQLVLKCMEPYSLGDATVWQRRHELQFPTWLLATLAPWRRCRGCYYNVRGKVHLTH